MIRNISSLLRRRLFGLNNRTGSMNKSRSRSRGCRLSFQQLKHINSDLDDKSLFFSSLSISFSHFLFGSHSNLVNSLC